MTALPHARQHRGGSKVDDQLVADYAALMQAIEDLTDDEIDELIHRAAALLPGEETSQ